MTATRSARRPAPRSVGLVALTMTALLVASCGDPDETATPTPSSTSAPPTTTLALAGDVDAPSDRTLAGDDAQTLREGVALEPAVRYVTGPEFGRPGFEIAVDGPTSGPAYGWVRRGLVTITAREDSYVDELVVMDAAMIGLFVDQTVDLVDLTTPEEIAAATRSAENASLVDHLAGLTFVESTPLDDTTVAGFPARGVEFSVEELDGASDCGGELPGPCMPVFTSIGLAIVYTPGQTGRMYEIEVGGHVLAVQTSGSAVGEELLASLAIALAPPPDGLEAALDYEPGLTELVASTDYRYLLPTGTWLSFTTGLVVEPTAPIDFVDLAAYAGIIDWFGDSSLPTPVAPQPNPSDPSTMTAVEQMERGADPDDLVQGVAAVEYLEVVDGPTETTVGPFDASYVDVTLPSDRSGFECFADRPGVCAYPLGFVFQGIRHGDVTRVLHIDIEPATGSGVLVISVLDDVTRPILASLGAYAAGS